MTKISQFFLFWVFLTASWALVRCEDDTDLGSGEDSGYGDMLPRKF